MSTPSILREADLEISSAKNGKAPSDKVFDLEALRQKHAAELTASKDSWKFYTLADAFKPRPPLIYPVAGVFSLGSLNVIYGAPGTLKTMLLCDAMMSVATGKAWLPPFPNATGAPFAVQQCPVMLVDFDGGARRSHERIEALARGRGITPSTGVQFHYTSMPMPWLNASERDSVSDLARYIKDRGVGLVTIDNLGAVSGGVDENSAAMVTVMGNLRWLTEESGACVNVIHHARKGTGEAHANGDSLRGHSSINAAVDLALLVEREGGSRMVSMRSTKTRDVDVKPFGAEFTYSHKPGTTELDTAGFYGVAGDDEGSDTQIEQAILQVTKQPINQSQMVAEVKKILPQAGVHRTKSLAASLVLRGTLFETTGDKNAKVLQSR